MASPTRPAPAESPRVGTQQGYAVVAVRCRSLASFGGFKALFLNPRTAILNVNVRSKNRPAMNKLKDLIENRDTRSGALFDYLIQILIILSLLSLAVETLPNLSAGFVAALEIFEFICIVIFTVKYLLRLLVADRALSYVKSFYELIDLLAILPYYLFPMFDLRFIRAFRVFRIFRSLKLIRYNRALRRFKIAYNLIHEELILFFIFTTIILFFGAVGIYYFENPVQPQQFQSVIHSLYWAVVTLTTVGYGDI